MRDHQCAEAKNDGKSNDYRNNHPQPAGDVPIPQNSNEWGEHKAKQQGERNWYQNFARQIEGCNNYHYEQYRRQRRDAATGPTPAGLKSVIGCRAGLLAIVLLYFVLILSMERSATCEDVESSAPSATHPLAKRKRPRGSGASLPNYVRVTSESGSAGGACRSARPAGHPGRASASAVQAADWAARPAVEDGIALCSEVIEDKAAVPQRSGEAYAQRGLMQAHRWTIMATPASTQGIATQGIATQGIADITEALKLHTPPQARKHLLWFVRARLYAATGQNRRASEDFNAILRGDPAMARRKEDLLGSKSNPVCNAERSSDDCGQVQQHFYDASVDGNYWRPARRNHRAPYGPIGAS